MAILGSKGSGKRALLDVIAKRADGRGRGSVLLNGAPLTKNLFQQRCAYVTHQVDFIPGLSVSQTLHYTPTILSGYLKSSKVRQILADLALSQVSNKKVENLNVSERRRLAIGIQLVRDPVMLLLDEPTQGLDPLAAYLLISILSNTAKKTGCGILLSLEKPRSDVFPFLDRWDDQFLHILQLILTKILMFTVLCFCAWVELCIQVELDQCSNTSTTLAFHVHN